MPEGVEAWSVANRSGLGVEAAGMIHPIVRMRIANINNNFVLFIFRLNGFKIALFTRQDFCANAAAIRT